MTLTLRKAELMTLLSKVINIVPVRSTLQILSNLSFSVQGNKIVMRATDLDLSITTSAQLKAQAGSHEFIVNARKLFDVVKELPETDITLQMLSKESLKISTASDEFKLPIQVPENFPETPTFKERARFTLKNSVLEEMAARVRFAAAKDATRAALKGVLCEIEGDAIRMVATDGHKLSMCVESGLPEKTKEKISIILPAKALDQLPKIVPSPDDQVTVRVGQTYAEFSCGSTAVTTKLIEGDYPNYQEAIPKTSNKKAVVKRDELSSVLRRISVMSNSRTRQIRFAFSKEGLTLSTSDREFRGEGKSSLSLKYTGEPVAIGFNADFFIEILRLMDDDEVLIEMNTPLAAAVLKPVSKEKADRMLFLIMPLRLLDEEANG